MNRNPIDVQHFQRKLSVMAEREMRLEPGSVATDRNLAEYGLDSIAALTIAGDLEDELGIELPPTLLWDHPTIDELATYLHVAASSKWGDGL